MPTKTRLSAKKEAEDSTSLAVADVPKDCNASVDFSSESKCETSESKDVEVSDLKLSDAKRALVLERRSLEAIHQESMTIVSYT